MQIKNMKPISIKTRGGIRYIGPGYPSFIVAEMSGNHNQSFELATKIIDAAAEAGADAIKLQTYTADTMTIDSDKKYFQVKINDAWKGQTLRVYDPVKHRIFAKPTSGLPKQRVLCGKVAYWITQTSRRLC